MKDEYFYITFFNHPSTLGGLDTLDKDGWLSCPWANLPTGNLRCLAKDLFAEDRQGLFTSQPSSPTGVITQNQRI